MTDLWMPGAARHSLGNTGTMNGGPARAVWHITSNAKDWTYTAELGWFTGGGAAVAPHLLWDPFSGQVAQFFPADSRSLSLQNAGDVRTNRTGKYCVQIEVVFTAGETVGGKKYATVKDTPCKGLGAIMAWLRSLGITDAWPGGAPTAFARDTVSLDTWLKLGGHYGHNQIPGNSHVDPGPMPNLFAAAPATTPSKNTEKSMQLTDAVTVGTWVKAQWPDDKGLQDGKISVNTALGSGYAHARAAHEGVDLLRAEVADLRAAVVKLTDAVTKGS